MHDVLNKDVRWTCAGRALDVRRACRTCAGRALDVRWSRSGRARVIGR